MGNAKNKKLLATLTGLCAFSMIDALAYGMSIPDYREPATYDDQGEPIVTESETKEKAAAKAPAPINTVPAALNTETSPPTYVPPTPAPVAVAPAAPEPNNINAATQNPAAANAAAPPAGEYIPAAAPNYVEAGFNYYNVTHNYGNSFGQFANVQYQSDPWNRWNAGIQHATAFKDEGEAFSIGNTHTFDEDWYSDVGIGVGSGASFLIRDRFDVAINRKLLPGRNLIATLGFTYDDSNDTYSDRTLHLATAYYFQTIPLVVQAGFNLNESNPGSVIAPSGFGAVTYGYQKHYLVSVRYAIAREAYQLLGNSSNITNGFTSHTGGVSLRKWVGDDWGFNVGGEYYTNPYYDRTGGSFSLFKEF